MLGTREGGGEVRNTKPASWTGIKTLLPDCSVRIPVSTMRQPSVCSQTWRVQVRRMAVNSAFAENCHISKDSAQKLTAVSDLAPSERLHNILTGSIGAPTQHTDRFHRSAYTTYWQVPSERLHNILTGSIGAPAQHTDRLHRSAMNLSKFLSNSGRFLDIRNSHIQITHHIRSFSVHRFVLNKWNGRQNLCPIREIPGSNMQPDTSYTNYVFFCFLGETKRISLISLQRYQFE
jgi:hypothetical protein